MWREVIMLSHEIPSLTNSVPMHHKLCPKSLSCAFTWHLFDCMCHLFFRFTLSKCPGAMAAQNPFSDATASSLTYRWVLKRCAELHFSLVSKTSRRQKSKSNFQCFSSVCVHVAFPALRWARRVTKYPTEVKRGHWWMQQQHWWPQKCLNHPRTSLLPCVLHKSISILVSLPL